MYLMYHSNEESVGSDVAGKQVAHKQSATPQQFDPAGVGGGADEEDWDLDVVKALKVDTFAC